MTCRKFSSDCKLLKRILCSIILDRHNSPRISRQAKKISEKFAQNQTQLSPSPRVFSVMLYSFMLHLASVTESINAFFVFAGQISQLTLNEEEIYKSD